MKTRTCEVLATAIALLLASAAPGVRAEPAWKPERPVTLVVPYAAGGDPGANAPAAFTAPVREESERLGEPVRRYPPA